jgi:hypothetical protein
VGGARQRRDHLAGAAGGERVDQAVPGGQAPEPPQAGVEPVDRGVEPVREQGQRRPVGDLHQAGRADGHALGQVTMPSGARGDGDVVDRGAAVPLGHRQIGQVPAAVGLPPDRRPRLRPDPAQVIDRPRLRVDYVQLVGDDTRIRLRARPADDRQRTAIRSRRHLDDVAVAEAVHRANLAGGEVKQSQPGVGQLLSPGERVVALGAPALVLLGRLVRGHHGDQPAVRERSRIRDFAVPVSQGLGLPAAEPYPLQLAGAGAIREEENRRRVRRPPRTEIRRRARGQLHRR